jgi:hypothetical protein
MTIKFQTNVPVELRLRSTEGKPVESQFGGMQHMFSADEGAFYVSETVGAILTEQCRKLGVRPGEAIDICKAEVTANGRKRIEWQVSKVGETPEPPTELEQKLAASIAQVEQRKQAQQATAAAAPPAWADALVSQACVLVDAFAAVVKHSAQYQGLVKPDDARSIMLSAFINMTKSNGGRNAA